MLDLEKGRAVYTPKGGTQHSEVSTGYDNGTMERVIGEESSKKSLSNKDIVDSMPKRYISKKFRVHYETTNESFIQVAADLKEIGVKNYTRHLAIYDTSLIGVDPHSKDLTKAQQLAIIYECKRNPFYFLRECLKIKNEGATDGGVSFDLNLGSLSLIFLHIIGVDVYLTLPRQVGKTIVALAIITWDYLFGATDSTMLFFNKDAGQAQTNLGRMKSMIDALPEYLQFKYMIDDEGKVEKGKNNVKSITNVVNKNMVLTKPSATSNAAADGLGRGDTSPIHYYDEVEFSPYINTIVEAAGPSYVTASQNARKNGSAYGRIFTSTPGDIDSNEGKAAKEILDRTCKWRTMMFDMSVEEIKRYVKMNSNNGIIYVEYSYTEIGKDQEWFERACTSVQYVHAKVQREILLRRMRGATNAAFDVEQLEDMMEYKIDPVRIDTFMGVFDIRFYTNNIDKNKVYVAGIDPAKGTLRDYTALTVVDPVSLKPIIEFRSRAIQQPDFVKLILHIAFTYIPKAVWVVENQGGGTELQQQLRRTPLVNKLYKEDRLPPNREKLDDKGWVEEEALKSREFGHNTNGTTRPLMMTILINHMDVHRDRFISDYICNDIAGLVQKNGVIDHKAGGHNDSLMSYLIALYTLYYGKNKKQFGIHLGISTDTMDGESHTLTREEYMGELNESGKEVGMTFERTYTQTEYDIQLRMEREKIINENRNFHEHIEGNAPVISYATTEAMVSSVDNNILDAIDEANMEYAEDDNPYDDLW